MRSAIAFVIGVVLVPAAVRPADAGVVRLKIDRREVVLQGRPFAAAGPYEKLSGRAYFALDPKRTQNQLVVDLLLAPRNARGDVEFSADFYLLKPVDPSRGNGRLLFEVGNRGTKRALVVFQKARASEDPTTEAEFGDGALMKQGFAILWLGWQWDVPDGRMRMEMPIATDNGRPIRGLVRGNFIGAGTPTALVADRGHKAYAPIDPSGADAVMTVRNLPWETGRVIPRASWRFTGPETVALDGGFEWGRIYEVVYTAENPRVVGCGLAGPRDLISFFKHATAADGNPMPAITAAIGWGVSQSGRYLRHFLYQGFNEDEQGRRVFDGVIDQMGGAGRGSFNHRFGQASRDALQHFNIQYPVDMFPFTDARDIDPVTKITDGVLARAEQRGVTPKVFHVLTNSEYFNRGGSLVHTDPAGTRDVAPPASSRIYFIAGAPHIQGAFPPGPNPSAEFLGRASMNPLEIAPVIRALFRAMDRWVSDDAEPPPSRYPRLADGTLAAPGKAGWPAIPSVTVHPEPHTPHRLDFGPDWPRGIVSLEPPKVGAPFVVRVPAVDADGNDRAGIHVPELAVPLATHTGWNYRHASVGAPDRLSSEIGSYLPFAKTKAEREQSGDPRLSIAERYASRDAYMAAILRAAQGLVDGRYLLAEDVAGVVERAGQHYDWATERR